MNTPSRRVALAGALAFTGLLAAITGAYAVGVRWNITPSVPTGLYLQTDPAIQRDQLVLACLDTTAPAVRAALARGYLPPGHCPGQVAPVLKRIVALPGDTVTATAKGLAVNGVLLPGTVALKADPLGRPLPQPPAQYTVAPGTVLLATDHPQGFDGRYFGPIPADFVTGAARPLLLF